MEQRFIVFRGQRTDKNGWVYGDLCTQDIYHGVSIRQGGCIINAVIPETVGQWSGLIDRNGLRIYEGDIAITNDRTGVCEFHNGMFAINDHDPDTTHTYSDPSEWEIIGNIFDAPEKFCGSFPVR